MLISCASSVNFAGSCSLEARAANSFHRSKCFDIILHFSDKKKFQRQLVGTVGRRVHWLVPAKGATKDARKAWTPA